MTSPWKKTPFVHQEKTLEFHLAARNTLDTSEVGIGKTAPAVVAIDQLVKQGKISRILIIAPKPVLRVWEENITEWSDLTYVSLYAKTKAKRIKAFNGKQVNCYLINYEGVRVMSEFLMPKGRWTLAWDLILCDEIHHIAHWSATQTKLILKLAQVAKARKGLTGTIITNQLIDTWSIAQFIDPKILRMNVWGFQYKFMYDQNEVTCRVESPRDGSHVKIFFSGVVALEIEQELNTAGFYYHAAYRCWQAERNLKTIAVGEDFRHRAYLKFPKMVPRIGAVEEVQRLLAPHTIRWEKKDVLPWLPPILFEKRYVELTDEEERAYRELKTLFVTELEGEEFAALHVLSRVTKLLEITSGFLYRDDEPTYWFKQSSKIAELKDLLQQIGNKQVMIWTAFRADMELIQGAVEGTMQINGDTPEELRQALLDSFSCGDFQYLISNPACVGEGLTILVPYVIYFSRGWKLVERIQSLGRHHRPGAERYESVTVIDLIAGGTVDEKVLRSIDEKEDLLAALSPKKARELFE